LDVMRYVKISIFYQTLSVSVLWYVFGIEGGRIVFIIRFQTDTGNQTVPYLIGIWNVYSGI